MQVFTTDQAIEFGMFVILVGREARNQVYAAKLGVAWSVRNRVDRPGWWGRDWLTVIERKAQYTSMSPPNGRDPNLVVYPDFQHPEWRECIEVCELAFFGSGDDPTHGCDSYFDRSMDDNPPNWASKLQHICDIDAMHFYMTPRTMSA